MAENIANFLNEAFNGNKELVIIIISMILFLELKGSIPIAITMGFNFGYSLLYAWIGSSLVAPILLLLLKPVLKLLKRTKLFKKLSELVETKFTEKADRINEKAINEQNKLKLRLFSKTESRRLFGLFWFVALPLPLTGVWTSSGIAVFLELPFFKALSVIVGGNLLAAIIMTLLSYYAKDYINWILWGLFTTVIIIILGFIVRGVMKNKQKGRAGKFIGDEYNEEVNKVL